MLLKDERTDPRATRTRSLLVDAFERLLAEKTFDDVTVGAITTRAQVHRATFYAHFTDKHAMVNDLFQERFAKIIERRIQPRSGTANEMVHGLLLALTDHWAGINTKCRPTYQRFETPVEHHVVAFLRSWVREWLANQPMAHNLSEQRLSIAAGTISGAIYGAALEWRRNAGRQNVEMFADDATHLIVASIAAVAD